MPKSQRNKGLREIACSLNRHGYAKVDADVFSVCENKMKQVYAERFPIGQHLYSDSYKIDFIINHPGFLAPLGLIYRHQEPDSSGTADRKIAFDIESIKINRYNVCFVLGEGLIDGMAEKYLLQQETQMGQLVATIGIRKLDEFISNLPKHYHP